MQPIKVKQKLKQLETIKLILQRAHTALVYLTFPPASPDHNKIQFTFKF